MPLRPAGMAFAESEPVRLPEKGSVMFGVDWQSVFMPDTPVLEIVARGTVMYLSLFFLLRFVLRREAGALGITDLLVIVLIADAAQNGMAGDYQSISDGLILVVTLVVWAYVLNWLSFNSPFFRKMIRPPRVLLVRDGRPIDEALEKEKISMDELMGEVRTHGIDDLRRVKRAYIESDGMISVITYKQGGEASVDSGVAH
jgi:uncharacterized membrane protein YcaP (DUF421 family)